MKELDLVRAPQLGIYRSGKRIGATPYDYNSDGFCLARLPVIFWQSNGRPDTNDFGRWARALMRATQYDVSTPVIRPHFNSELANAFGYRTYKAFERNVTYAETLVGTDRRTHARQVVISRQISDNQRGWTTEVFTVLDWAETDSVLGEVLLNALASD
jgi:hypothetical protein